MKITLNIPNKKNDRIVILIKNLYHLWAFFLLNTFHVNNFPFNLLWKLKNILLGKKNEKKIPFVCIRKEKWKEKRIVPIVINS